MPNTFTLRRRDGTTEDVKFTPLIVTAGTVTHKLALHQDRLGDWVVSDPKSGAAVIRRITGWYKGCPISVGKATKKQVQVWARDAVDNLIARIGSDKFNATLANPKPF